MHASGGAGEPGQGDGEPARTGTRLKYGAARAHAELEADQPHVLGIHDLRLALDAHDQIVELGAQHAEGHAERGAHLAPEGCGRQIGHADDAVLGVPVPAFFDAHHAAFAAWREQYDQIAVPGHDSSFSRAGPHGFRAGDRKSRCISGGHKAPCRTRCVWSAPHPLPAGR